MFLMMCWDILNVTRFKLILKLNFLQIPPLLSFLLSPTPKCFGSGSPISPRSQYTAVMGEAGHVPMGWHHLSLQVPVISYGNNILDSCRPGEALVGILSGWLHHHCILETNTNFFTVLLTLVQCQWL